LIRPKNSKRKQIKVCPICQEHIDEEEYEDHIASCSSEQTTSNNRRDCPNVKTDSNNRNSSGYSGEVNISFKICYLYLNV
jgi:hypothetical protein